MAERLLWIDFETEGLDYRRKHAVLEAAWTITDASRGLTQLTPMRSRLCKIPPPGDDGNREWPSSLMWDETVDRVVAEMHKNNGLRIDWSNANGTSLDTWRDLDSKCLRMLHSGVALEQIILDDLASVTEPGSVVRLAGSGVASFDQPLLAAHCPRLAPQSEGGLLHYRTFDLSVTAQVLGIEPPSLDSVHTMRTDWVADHDGQYPKELVLMRGDGPFWADVFSSELVVPHRAASDVAVSLLFARLLRAS